MTPRLTAEREAEIRTFVDDEAENWWPGEATETCETLLAEIDALRAERAQTWRPISEAPKNTYVSVRLAGVDYSVTAICTNSRGTDTWFLAGGYEGAGVRLNPTHWMRLPTPPEGAA